MNVVGRTLKVLESADPTKRGRSGVVVLESAKTLVVSSDGNSFRIKKAGSVFQLMPSNAVVVGADIKGRLEDRWGSKFG